MIITIQVRLRDPWVAVRQQVVKGQDQVVVPGKELLDPWDNLRCADRLGVVGLHHVHEFGVHVPVVASGQKVHR